VVSFAKSVLKKIFRCLYTYFRGLLQILQKRCLGFFCKRDVRRGRAAFTLLRAHWIGPGPDIGKGFLFFDYTTSHLTRVATLLPSACAATLGALPFVFCFVLCCCGCGGMDSRCARRQPYCMIKEKYLYEKGLINETSCIVQGSICSMRPYLSVHIATLCKTCNY